MEKECSRGRILLKKANVMDSSAVSNVLIFCQSVNSVNFVNLSNLSSNITVDKQFFVNFDSELNPVKFPTSKINELVMFPNVSG